MTRTGELRRSISPSDAAESLKVSLLEDVGNGRTFPDMTIHYIRQAEDYADITFHSTGTIVIDKNPNPHDRDPRIYMFTEDRLCLSEGSALRVCSVEEVDDFVWTLGQRAPGYEEISVAPYSPIS